MAWSSPLFFAPGAVLMGADDRCVDHPVFDVGVARQVIQNTIESPALAPSSEALVRAFPRTKMRRQIAPRNARPISSREPRRRTADCPAPCRPPTWPSRPGRKSLTKRASYIARRTHSLLRRRTGQVKKGPEAFAGRKGKWGAPGHTPAYTPSRLHCGLVGHEAGEEMNSAPAFGTN
jgi:hypothetical protein